MRHLASRLASRQSVGAAIALVLAAPSVPVEAIPSPTPRSNIVVIVVDDLRWDMLGYAGHAFARTPNIDRIAREGARFLNAFASNPLCSPSRASLLTGQYSHSHRVLDNSDHSALSHRLPTFARRLQEAGYETAHIGKWHMGQDDSRRPGFDHWVSFAGQGEYENPALNVDGKKASGRGYLTDILTQYAVEFVTRKRDKPFLLLLAHKAVHGPSTPAARHRDAYSDARWDAAAMPTTAKDRSIALRQLRCLLSVDEGIGRLLASLQETGQLDRTVVVFTSDNGLLLSEHGITGKQAPYEESLRIPLAMRHGASIAPGTVVDELVVNIDVAPTLLEAALLAIPATIEGRSLWRLVRGDADGWRDSFLAEAFAKKRKDLPTWQAVRTRDWKYVRYVDRPERDELYNLQLDPRESRNLIREPAARERLAQLKGELAQLLAAGPYS